MDLGPHLSVREAADRLGLPEGRIQSAVRDGRLCAVRDGRTWRVLVNDEGAVYYRGDRVQDEWRGELIVHVGNTTSPWPPEVTARLEAAHQRPVDPAEATTARERELIAMVEELRRDREFERIAAESRAEDQANEIARLRTHLDEERRRRELGVRNALLGLAAMIPAADPDEARRFGLPVD